MGTLSLESLRFGLSFILSQIESAEEGAGDTTNLEDMVIGYVVCNLRRWTH
jgi:hypothetical protein